ncbi:MAG: response regulator transcription factor [Bacteroidota bacterium]|nr:response regulator transcription factor [Bacteroidota bacterium]
MKKPDIIIVDDHQIFRQGIKSIISLENIATVIGEASNGEEFIKLLTFQKPDLVLMDIDMPHMNGLEATEKALELIPDLKIIAFTLYGDEEYFLKMIDMGAKGYVLKSSDISELEKAIHFVMRGEKYFSNHQFKRSSGHSGSKSLKKLSENEIHINNNKTSEDLFPHWF